jgi:hypothetical protein
MNFMKAFTAAALLLFAPIGFAHNLWLEDTSDGSRARFGEPEINVFERSPGKLDRIEITRADAMLKGQRQPLPWSRNADGFGMKSTSSGGTTIVEARWTAARTNAETKATTETRFYARSVAWPLAAASAEMTLDIVPLPEANTFGVYFKGAPLTKGTLKVIAPSLWLQVHDIDEHGRVRINAPWQGRYVLDVETRDPKEKADVVVHRATLSFMQTDGQVVESPRAAQYRAD